MSMRGEAMEWLAYLSGNAVLERLFWASVEMAVLAAAVWGLTALFRPGSPRVRALLWLLVLVKPLTALAIGPLYPVFQLETAEVRYASVDLAPPRPGAAIPPGAVVAGAPRQLAAAPPAPTPACGGGLAWPGSDWTAVYEIDTRWLAVAVWFGAVLFLSAYKGADAVRLRRIARGGATPPAALLEHYAMAARELGVKRPPRLVITAACESPALAGMLRPVILVPAWMAESAGTGVVAWAVRHELTHWKLGDTLANLVRQLSHVFFFFHPATWWAGARWEESAELACDRALVNTQGDADAYAGTLYQVLAEIRGRRSRAVAGGLCATRTQVGRRIAALLGNPLLYPARLGAWAATGLILLTAFVLGLGGAFNDRAAAEAETSSQAAATTEDVEAQIRKAIDDLSVTSEMEVGRVSAVFALVKAQPNAAALHALIPWLANEEPTKRRSAIYIIEALQWADPAPAFEPLRDLLPPGQEIFTRGMAAMALASQGDAASYDAILDMARNDADGYVRRCAAWALGEFGDAKALEPLRQIAQDKDPFVAANAANAIDRLTFLAEHADASGDAARVVRAIFIVSGSTPMKQERLQFAQALVNGANPAARDAVFLAASQDPSQAIKNSVAYLLRDLAAAPQEEAAPAQDQPQTETPPTDTPADATPADAEQAALTQTLEQPVSLEFENIHVIEILEFIANSYEVNPVVDWRVVAPPKRPPARVYATDGIVPYLNLSNVSLRVALEALLRPLGLTFREEHGVVWISTEEQMRKDSAFAGAAPAASAQPAKGLEVLESPVSLEFENIHLQEIAEFISDSYDLNLVIDSRAVPPPGRASDNPPAGSRGYVTDGIVPYVHLSDLRLKYCLEFLLRPLNLVWIPAEGYVWITSLVEPPEIPADAANASDAALAAPVGETDSGLALLRVRTLPDGTERAQIRTPGGGVRWYSEGEVFEAYTLLEIRGEDGSARLRVDGNGSEIALHSELDGRPAETAASGPRLQFRWEAREGGNEPFDEVGCIPRDGKQEPALKLERAVLVNETDIRSVTMRESKQAGLYDVLITLSDEAAARFGDATAANVGRRLAIVYDGQILNAPVVRDRIGMEGVISGLQRPWAEGVVEAIQHALGVEGTAARPAENTVDAAVFVQTADVETAAPQFSLEARFIHIPETNIESLLAMLERIMEPVVSPRDVIVYRVAEPAEVLNRIEGLPDCELVSAPRVSFRPLNERTKLVLRMRNPQESQDVQDMIRGYSPSLESFWNDGPPSAMVADLATEYFRESSSAQPQQIHYGVVLAVRAAATDTPEILDLDLYLNNTRLHHRSRGLAFWRLKPAPEVLEHPVRVRARLRADESIGIMSRSSTTGLKQLVLLTLTAVEGEGSAFHEAMPT